MLDRERDLIAAARAQLGSSDDSQDSTFAELPGAAAAVVPNVAGYRIQRELHRGGQGVVYVATQESTQRDVAMKFIRTGELASDAEIARLEREAQVLAKLRHPNIVTIHDRGRAGSLYYLVMDYINGRPLNPLLLGSGVGIRGIVVLFVKLCDAVAAAHVRGIIHRDLKPGNILVDRANEPHVLDFGLAKLIERDAAEHTLTESGQFVGSLPWASPEQVDGVPGGLDVRSDVYALGVLLYQMLTGRFPYEVQSSMRAVMQNIATAAPTPLRSYQPRLDSDLETIVLKCLAKEPARRYQSATELHADLRRYLSGAPIAARRDSTWYVTRKLAWRYRIPVGAAACVFLATLVAGVTATISLQEVRAARRAEQQQRTEAEQRLAQLQVVTDFQNAMTERLDPQKIGEAFEQSLARRLVDVEESRGSSGAVLAHADMTDIAREVLAAQWLHPAREELDGRTVGEPRVEADVRQTLANAYWAIGLPAEALAQQRLVHEQLVAALGARHEETLIAAGNLCHYLAGADQFEEAERLGRVTLAIARDELGAAHRATLSLAGNLASMYAKLGRPNDALPLLREAARAAELDRNVDPEHRAFLHNQLGLLLAGAGELDGAEQHFEVALGIDQDRNADVVTLASTRGNLASIALRRGEVDEAVAQFRGVRSIFVDAFGETHPKTLFVQANLATTLFRAGQLDEAEREFRDLIRKLEASGANESELYDPIASLAQVRLAQGEPDGALEAIQRSVDIVDRLGLDRSRKLAPLNARLRVYTETEQFALAVVTAGELAEIARSLPVTDERRGMMLINAGHSVALAAEQQAAAYHAAEQLFLEGYDALASESDVPPAMLSHAAGRINAFYESWLVAEPGNAGAHRGAMDWAQRTGSGE